jgi:phosphatidylinositol kinase/protein kinase (PI-3  family)
MTSFGKVDASTVGAASSSTAGSSIRDKKSDVNVSRNVSLSVEGHVEHLIQQAVDHSNLGAMFVGWAPWV